VYGYQRVLYRHQFLGGDSWGQVNGETAASLVAPLAPPMVSCACIECRENHVPSMPSMAMTVMENVLLESEIITSTGGMFTAWLKSSM